MHFILWANPGQMIIFWQSKCILHTQNRYRMKFLFFLVYSIEQIKFESNGIKFVIKTPTSIYFVCVPKTISSTTIIISNYRYTIRIMVVLDHIGYLRFISAFTSSKFYKMFFFMIAMFRYHFLQHLNRSLYAMESQICDQTDSCN